MLKAAVAVKEICKDFFDTFHTSQLVTLNATAGLLSFQKKIYKKPIRLIEFFILYTKLHGYLVLGFSDVDPDPHSFGSVDPEPERKSRV